MQMWRRQCRGGRERERERHENILWQNYIVWFMLQMFAFFLSVHATFAQDVRPKKQWKPQIKSIEIQPALKQCLESVQGIIEINWTHRKEARKVSIYRGEDGAILIIAKSVYSTSSPLKPLSLSLPTLKLSTQVHPTTPNAPSLDCFRLTNTHSSASFLHLIIEKPKLSAESIRSGEEGKLAPQNVFGNLGGETRKSDYFRHSLWKFVWLMGLSIDF